MNLVTAVGLWDWQPSRSQDGGAKQACCHDCNGGIQQNDSRMSDPNPNPGSDLWLESQDCRLVCEVSCCSCDEYEIDWRGSCGAIYPLAKYREQRGVWSMAGIGY